MNATPEPRRKVLLLELNEITWRLLDPLCAAGKLPTFSRFIEQGVRATAVADEVPPNLDPWVSWTTVYTGRPQSEHGVQFLEQPPETVTGPRVWDVAARAGRSVGIFGSVMSWPPRRDIEGFWVPGTFSPDADTFPEDLRPIQELNLSQTRAHSPLGADSKLAGKVRLVRQLRKLGLRAATVGKLVSFLARVRLRPHRYWEKVSLQPLVNLDFFEALYARHRPALATFHSNHVAHYQHRYWRAADPAPFLVKPSDDEVRRYGPAIEFGYHVADEVLRRAWALADEHTVVVIASALGAQPYVVEEFAAGRAIVRLRDVRQIVGLCGATGCCQPLSVMAPQWNLRFTDPVRQMAAERTLRTAWYRTPEISLFAVQTVGNTICFNVAQKNLRPLDLAAPCVFPEAGDRRFTLGELCATADATPKQGQHERGGVLMMSGPGVRKGARLNDCSNLDIAPTILHLLGLDVPRDMQGRVLEEALDDAPPRAAMRPSALPASDLQELVHVGV